MSEMRLIDDPGPKTLKEWEVPVVSMIGAVPYISGPWTVYDKDDQRWRFWNGKLVAYYRYRPQEEIRAGYHPWLEIWTDGMVHPSTPEDTAMCDAWNARQKGR